MVKEFVQKFIIMLLIKFHDVKFIKTVPFLLTQKKCQKQQKKIERRMREVVLRISLTGPPHMNRQQRRKFYRKAGRKKALKTATDETFKNLQDLFKKSWEQSNTFEQEESPKLEEDGKVGDITFVGKDPIFIGKGNPVFLGDIFGQD